MKLNILLFGALTEITGKSAISLETEQIQEVQHLYTYLIKEYPALKGKPFRYAVNQTIVQANHPLREGDEVALLPPFSGG